MSSNKISLINVINVYKEKSDAKSIIFYKYFNSEPSMDLLVLQLCLFDSKRNVEAIGFSKSFNFSKNDFSGRRHEGVM